MSGWVSDDSINSLEMFLCPLVSGKEVSFRFDKDRPTTAQQHQTRAENRERGASERVSEGMSEGMSP